MFSIKTNFTFQLISLSLSSSELQLGNSRGIPLLGNCLKCHSQGFPTHPPQYHHHHLWYDQEGIDSCKAFGADLWSLTKGHQHLWGERWSWWMWWWWSWWSLIQRKATQCYRRDNDHPLIISERCGSNKKMTLCLPNVRTWQTIKMRISHKQVGHSFEHP